jgi:hypothetical protein
VCIAAAVAFPVFHERGRELLADVSEAQAGVLTDRLTGIRVHTYDSATSAPCNDQRHHTHAPVPTLRGLRSVPTGVLRWHRGVGDPATGWRRHTRACG